MAELGENGDRSGGGGGTTDGGKGGPGVSAGGSAPTKKQQTIIHCTEVMTGLNPPPMMAMAGAQYGYGAYSPYGVPMGMPPPMPGMYGPPGYLPAVPSPHAVAAPWMAPPTAALDPNGYPSVPGAVPWNPNPPAGPVAGGDYMQQYYPQPQAQLYPPPTQQAQPQGNYYPNPAGAVQYQPGHDDADMVM